MPKTLLQHESKKKILVSRLCLSNDWFSLKPWSHEGKVMPYFGIRTHEEPSQVRDDIKVEIRSMFIGPIAIQFARAHTGGVTCEDES